MLRLGQNCFQGVRMSVRLFSGSQVARLPQRIHHKPQKLIMEYVDQYGEKLPIKETPFKHQEKPRNSERLLNKRFAFPWSRRRIILCCVYSLLFLDAFLSYEFLEDEFGFSRYFLLTFTNEKGENDYYSIRKRALLRHSDYYRENRDDFPWLMKSLGNTTAKAAKTVSRFLMKNVLPEKVENVEETFYLAHRLKLEKLKAILQPYILERPATMRNVVKRLELAAKIEEADRYEKVKEERIEQLWQGAISLFAQNYKAIMASEEWLELEKRNLSAARAIVKKFRSDFNCNPENLLFFYKRTDTRCSTYVFRKLGWDV